MSVGNLHVCKVHPFSFYALVHLCILKNRITRENSKEFVVSNFHNNLQLISRSTIFTGLPLYNDNNILGIAILLCEMRQPSHACDILSAFVLAPSLCGGPLLGFLTLPAFLSWVF